MTWKLQMHACVHTAHKTNWPKTVGNIVRHELFMHSIYYLAMWIRMYQTTTAALAGERKR